VDVLPLDIDDEDVEPLVSLPLTTNDTAEGNETSKLVLPDLIIKSLNESTNGTAVTTVPLDTNETEGNETT